jgi:ATP-dependent Clp protease adaptor protein ClpS
MVDLLLEGKVTEKKNQDHQDDSRGGVLVERRVKTRRPSMYKVLLLNDDYTPMDFVIEVLEKFFQKAHAEATEIMLNVHNKGMGVCGVFTHEVAETKVALVNEYARQAEYPLQCTLEKA